MARPLIYVSLQQFCEQDDRPRRLLEGAGLEVRVNPLGRRLRREEMTALLRDADGILAGVEPYDSGILDALPRLRCISRCGVGTDAIDLEAARRRGITIYTTTDEVVEPVAQLTMAMILALARHIPQQLAEMRAGQWTKRIGALLSEWTIGLVGFGRIGRAVARYLWPFGPRLLAADPHVDARDLPEGVVLRPLPSLLAESHLVSLHASRRVTEGPLISRAEFALMPRGSYLVNTARGFLVDETVLYEALCSGALAGAALDVFQDEPCTSPLAQLPNVLCTPHIATLTNASRTAMEWRCAYNVVQHFATKIAPACPAG